MMKFVTASDGKSLKGVEADVWFPENGKSPSEQLEWVDENIAKDEVVVTYSPYILNYLNCLIVEGKYEARDDSVMSYFDEGEGMSLVCDCENGKIVDTSEFSDTITYIYKRYREAVSRKR